MTVWHLALDDTGDANFPLASEYGRIVGMALSVADLRASGFANPPYTGNRLVQIDTDTVTVWSDACMPGWYKTPDGVQLTRPMTVAAQTLATNKAKGLAALDQLDAWHADLDRLKGGHRAQAHQDGCDYLLIGRRCFYLVWTNGVSGATYTLDQRGAFSDAVRAGPTDFNTAEEYYRVFDQLLAAGTTPDFTNAGLKIWANPATGARTAFGESVLIVPTNTATPIPSTVELGKNDWFEEITT